MTPTLCRKRFHFFRTVDQDFGYGYTLKYALSQRSEFISDKRNKLTSLLKNKKNKLGNRHVLFLGSNFESIPFIKFCQEYHFVCHVVDPNPNSPGKKYADRSVNIDGTDVEKLKIYCFKNDISVILLGVADKLVVPYAKLCAELGVPSYATVENAQIFSNKHLFNKVLLANGLLCIPGIVVNSIELYRKIEEIKRTLLPPLVVKPTDSVSGKGLCIVKDYTLLSQAINKSMDESTCKIVLVERLVVSPEVSLYFNFCDKNFSYLLSDKYSAKTGKGNVTSLQVYPSKRSDLISGKILENFRNIFVEHNVTRGVLLISAFYTNGVFCWYDPGFRLQGEPSDIHENFHLGSKSFRNLLNIACNNFDCNAFSSKIQNKVSATIWFLMRPGIITALKGFDRLRIHKNTIEIRQRLNAGDEVLPEDEGTERQVFARVCVWAKNFNELKQIIEFFRKSCEVLDSNGNNLLLHLDDWKNL